MTTTIWEQQQFGNGEYMEGVYRYKICWYRLFIYY
jgi:hypothetical protein